MKTVSIILLQIVVLFQISGQVVKPIGNGLTLRGEIFDFAIDDSNNQIYAVGNLSAIDGIEMENVGHFVNEKWNAVSDTSEVNGSVLCAEIYNGGLYIGGNFTIEGDSKITSLSKLENGVWKDMGIEKITGSISDLTWFNNELYVSGVLRSINGIKCYGLLKYSEGEWKDSGLNTRFDKNGLFVIGDTLFTWESGFKTDGRYTHVFSYFTNDRWTSLPEIESDDLLSSSYTYFKGEIYATIDNQLYRFNDLNYEWQKVATIPYALESVVLFDYKDELYVATDKLNVLRYDAGSFKRVAIEGKESNFKGKVNSIAVLNNDIIVGGNFSNIGTKSISLALIKNDSLTSFGAVSSSISLINEWNYAVGKSIVKYRDKFLIAGEFSFADNVYSPNLVYYDGEKFSPFEAPLQQGVKQLIKFENELYALPHGDKWHNPLLAPFKLIKFDGTQWKGVDVPIVFDEITLINDRLFVHHDYRNTSDDGGPFYLQNGRWNELKFYPVSGPIARYDYSNISPYKNGYLMSVHPFLEERKIIYLANDSSEWEVILDSIKFFYDNLTTFDNEIYLFNIWPQEIFRIKDGRIDTVALDVENELPRFFKIKDHHYFSAWNGNFYRVFDTLEYYNSLRVSDVEKLEEDKYLLAMQGGYYYNGLERKQLNNIGILSFKPLSVNLEQDQSNICTKTYAQYWPVTDHLNVNYSWQFEAGVPSHSTSLHPMVRYDSAGVFQIKMIAYNLDDTLEQTSEIQVVDCSTTNMLSDKYDNHWIMGSDYAKRGLGGFDFTFSDTIQTPRYHSPVELDGGSIVMSDKDGLLQFYSNGISILNMHNDKIKGSDCFNADIQDYGLDYYFSNQSILSLPDIKNDDLYHIFDLEPYSIDGEFWLASSNLSITSIDMSKNNGLGEVVACKEIIIDDILLNSTMQATRHANGIDWWIIVGKYQSDEYYKVLFTENGVESVETSSWGKFYGSLFSGQSTFSPDGNYFAQVIKENQEITLWKFDSHSGDLYEQQVITIATLDDVEYPVGCSFSPNSRFLYVSSLTQLRQIDLCNYNDIETEWIDAWNGSYEFLYPLYFGKQMLTPQKSIVIAPPGNSHYSFGLIEQPDQKGQDCKFKQHSLQINELTRNGGDVLPIFPHFRNYPSFEGKCKPVNTINEEETSFSVYPNPVGQESFLHFSKKIKGSIYSVTGTFMYAFEKTNYLDIKSLPAGIYIIKSKDGVQKIIIN